MKKATFGGGCFWCVEAVFERVNGVKNVVSGYAGGNTKNPSYSEVCSGTTGHAEVVEFEYDPDVVSYQKLLEVFFSIHDPTQKDRQGPDVGTQYRSIILYQDEQQEQAAREYIQQLEESGTYSKSIKTEVVERTHFYRAEEKHQDYYEQNSEQPYCQTMIPPKLNKAENVISSTQS